MNEQLKIYVDRLRDGHSEKIEEQLQPSFVQAEDDKLLFTDPIEVKGEAYLAEDRLVIHFDLSTSVRSPCIICNQEVVTKIAIANAYHTEEIKEIKGAIFDLTEPLRTALLLDVPTFVECHGGHCPERKNLDVFLKKGAIKEEEQKEFHPFDQLSFEGSKVVDHGEDAHQ